MPKLEEALYDYLSADANVSALVADRIYPVQLKVGTTFPAITFQRVSASRIYTYGPFEDADAWTKARVQINCWSDKALEAMDVGEAVLLALSGYWGEMSGKLIGSSDAVNEFDTNEPVGTKRYHRRILDFQISYEDELVAES